MAELVMTVEWDGRTDTIDCREFTAAEAKLFRREHGVSIIHAFVDADPAYTAFLVWLVRRRDNPRLKLSQVEESFTLGGHMDAVDSATGDVEDDDGPEA